MTVEDAIDDLHRLRDMTADRFPILSPDRIEPCTPELPFAEWATDWRDHMPESASGVYMYAWPEWDIAYVGKATRDNLSGEFWNHVGTPDHGDDGTVTFPGCRFLGQDVDDDLERAFRFGQFRLAAVEIEPDYLASLAEVWVQTVYREREGDTPPLNRRIG